MEQFVFAPGVGHKFWAAGDQVLRCTGYIKPANNVVYFLTALYDSTRANGGEKPDDFDAAYLVHKYSSEFDILEVPAFVKAIVFPALRSIGSASGKFKKYEDGPAPIA